MSSQRVFVLLGLVLLATPVLAEGSSETGDRFERRIERLVASPTPAGPLLLLSDAASWRVDVPNGALVHVEAEGSRTAPFYLRVDRMDAPPSTFPVPSSHSGYIVSAGSWRVMVDPAAGANVDITLRMSSAAPFTLTPIAHDRACLVASVCLP